MSAKSFRVAVTALAPMALGACSWFTDFRDQPAIQPWDSVADTIAPRGQPVNSVPVTGAQTPGYTISYAAFPAVLDSFNVVVNPRNAASLSKAELDSSINNGHRYYQQNCATCHGDTGVGNGPVTKYGMPGISLLTDMTKARTDGYIYGMMRNGRGVMPSYNRIEEPDRWDVVNYVRGLQGRLGRTVATGAFGYPGQTGWTIPTYTNTAPTRPAPMWRPSAAPAAPQPAGELTTAAPAAKKGTTK
ncbi:MAG: cytochrome c [Gemmatimonadaceae bacterium]|nr:cytochrome c [Gemmatimonadaceae bacterium]